MRREVEETQTRTVAPTATATATQVVMIAIRRAVGPAVTAGGTEAASAAETWTPLPPLLPSSPRQAPTVRIDTRGEDVLSVNLCPYPARLLLPSPLLETLDPVQIGEHIHVGLFLRSRSVRLA